VLRGHASEQVVTRGHDKLTTFGLLSSASVAEVRGYIEQLVGQALLRVTDDAYPVLSLTPQGVLLLKDATACPDLSLARQKAPQKGTTVRARIETESWNDVDRDLFDRLRKCLDIARACASRRMSSSTTRRCERWRACVPRPWTRWG
jgi:ATP-dependent DNA helicase RecQ